MLLMRDLFKGFYMFKKSIFLIFCLIAGSLSADETQFTEKASQINRYQLVVSNYKIYVLDKETGTVWYKHQESSSWIQQPPLPIQKLD
jgi:D-alanyl-D-alanine carboxypeptidase